MNNANIKPADFAEFFGELEKMVKDKIPYKCIKPKDCCYCYLPTGIEKTHFEWFFDEKTNRLKICLHSESASIEKNKRFFDIICHFKDIIEEKTEEKVKLKEKYEQKESWYGIYIEKEDICELNEDLKKWAANKMVIFYNTIRDELKRTLKMLAKF